MNKAIYFDMDGTIANLYAVKNWLEDLENENERPYKNAKVMINMSLLARYLNQLQKIGYTIGIVSWLSKHGGRAYNEKVTNIKLNWLRLHLKSVRFDEIHIIEYGTPKETIVKNPNGILFDDEKRNRDNWLGIAYNEKNILKNLKNLLTNTIQ